MKFEEFQELSVEEKKTFYLSLEWHEFVMSLLDESELNDGYPKADGLRRVSELLLGDIIDSKPTEIFPVSGNGIGRATVGYSVTFRWWDDSTRTYADVADVFDGNINDDFIIYALATAATRAEGRALRKALKLKICTAEELSDKVKKVQTKPTESSVTENQISFLNNRCKSMNIDVMKLINSSEERYHSVEQLSKKKCSVFIEKINRFYRKEEEVPQDIVGFQENWRGK